MGIRLEDIQDPRLREQITRQLCYGSPAPTTGKVHENTRLGPPDEPKNERDLHDEIIALCRSKGWFYVHSRMDRKSTTGVGVPDFCIALPNGKTVWLECKRKGGKPTTAQNAALAQLQRLGHAAYVVEDMYQVTVMLSLQFMGSEGQEA